MKKTILIIMFILCLPLIIASSDVLYGGGTWVYHFNECDKLRVNITAIDWIDEGEYTILNNCTKNQTNYYICDCDDNYDFNVSFNNLSINNFTFRFNYAYSKVIEEQKSSGGGGSSYSGGTCFSKWNCTEWSNCKPGNKAIRECKNTNNCYRDKPKEERYCYYYVESKEPIEEPEVIEQVEVTEPIEQPEPQEEEKGLSLGWWIVIVFIIIIVIIVIIYLIKSYELE